MVDGALGAWAEGRVKDLALRLSARDLTVAVAESLTGWLVTEVLARGPDASRWLRGGVVAYASGRRCATPPAGGSSNGP